MTRLISIADNIWIADGDMVDFHGFPYPTRSVVIRLPDDGLWIWSPIKPGEALLNEIRSIGRPEHLVSPNKLHHLFLGHWRLAFPAAKLWGPASTIQKRADLSFEPPLVDQPPAAWMGQIDQCWVRGSFMMDEIAFFHVPSRTVILADLSENFSSKWLLENWAPWQRSLARMMKIVEHWGYAPLDWRISFLRRSKLRLAAARILDWDPQKVIMAHGEWKPQDGREFLTRAFGWVGRPSSLTDRSSKPPSPSVR